MCFTGVSFLSPFVPNKFWRKKEKFSKFPKENHMETSYYDCVKFYLTPPSSLPTERLNKTINTHRDTSGKTALHIACIEGKSEWVTFLLKNGSNPKQTEELKNTPLHYACSNFCDLETIRNLLENGADPNMKNFFHHTPLYIQVLVDAGNLLKIGLLIEFGADVNTYDNQQTSLLECAQSRMKGQEIEKFLLKNGAMKEDDICKMLLDLGKEVY